jgi:hypothetical protein
MKQMDETKSHHRSMPAGNVNITTETYSHVRLLLCARMERADDQSEPAGSIGIAGSSFRNHGVARLDDSIDSLPDGQEDAKDMNTSEIRLV